MINRFSRILEEYDRYAVAQKKIVDRLFPMIDSGRHYRRILEIGCGSGNLSAALSMLDADRLYLNDLCPEAREVIAAKDCLRCPSEFLIGDAERMDFENLAGEVDLVASASALQWMTDLQAFSDKVFRMLVPDGQFVFSTFLPGNFREIRELTGVGIDYPSDVQLRRFLENSGFTVEALMKDEIVLHFPDAYEVLRHIRKTGVNSVSGVRWTRRRMEEFVSDYAGRFAVPEGVTLTYCPVYVSARKNPEH